MVPPAQTYASVAASSEGAARAAPGALSARRLHARVRRHGRCLEPYLVPTSVTIGVGLPDSLHLDHDLPFGSAPLEIRKRLPCLVERKYLVDHGPNAPHLEKVADLCELATVWIHEQE
jgi:hypothetical protein